MNNKLINNETILSGKWLSKNGQVTSDSVSKRIEFLIQSVLQEISSSDDGWDVLYIDPDDGRYWELIYVDSDSHGGGAPTLKCLSDSEAKNKYKF